MTKINDINRQLSKNRSLKCFYLSIFNDFLFFLHVFAPFKIFILLYEENCIICKIDYIVYNRRDENVCSEK